MKSGEIPHDKDTPKGLFLTTRWSRVLLAGDPSETGAQEALGDLCQEYWRPIYVFARGKGFSPEDAQDLTQSFIARLLEKQELAKADRERGRFRTFLLSSFCNFLHNHRRDQSAQKRGGGQAVLSLNDEEMGVAEHELRDTATPERHYERNWALTLLEKVTTKLSDEYEKAERADLLKALQPHLSGAEGRPGYAQLGAQLGMSESAVTVALHRMRRRYGDLLREEIAGTVATPEEVEDELQHLMKVVSAG